MELRNIFKRKTFVIAEIGSNFNQSLSQAFKLIDVAKSCGADAVKFQLLKQTNFILKLQKNIKFLNL